MIAHDAVLAWRAFDDLCAGDTVFAVMGVYR